MTTSEHQATFLRQIALLVIWADEMGYRVRAGQFHRSDEEQLRLRREGRSHTDRSRHQDRLAADLILDLWDGEHWVYQTDSPAYKPLGDFWKSLNSLNVWGGDWTSFPDGNHFERRIP